MRLRKVLTSEPSRSRVTRTQSTQPKELTSLQLKWSSSLTVSRYLNMRKTVNSFLSGPGTRPGNYASPKTRLPRTTTVRNTLRLKRGKCWQRIECYGFLTWEPIPATLATIGAQCTCRWVTGTNNVSAGAEIQQHSTLTKACWELSTSPWVGSVTVWRTVCRRTGCTAVLCSRIFFCKRNTTPFWPNGSARSSSHPPVSTWLLWWVSICADIAKWRQQQSKIKVSPR